MRRQTLPAAVTAAGISTMLALAGCGPPAGVDGDLAGGWAAMPEPAQLAPEPGTCHTADYSESISMVIYYHLGADFRHGRLWLGVSVPVRAAWEGGARWFRCEVLEERGGAAEPIWPDSLRGALTERSELSLGCFTVVPIDNEDEFGGIEQMDPVACTKPHQAEFVGIWRSDQPTYPDDEAGWGRIHRGCREQVAAFVDVPVDENLRLRTGTIFSPIAEEDWKNGNRSFRCHLWLDGKNLTESLKGAGPAGLPIN